MTRKEVFKEIEQTLGIVPSFFKLVPDRSLEIEWKLFKTLQLEESPIPNKYRELIGVAISAVTKCKYCSFFHTEVAKLFGASDAEIEDAVHYAKEPLDVKRLWKNYYGKKNQIVNQYQD